MKIQVGGAVLALKGKPGQISTDSRHVGQMGTVLDKVQDAAGEYFAVEFYDCGNFTVDYAEAKCLGGA